MTERVTMKHVAAQAGVSQATVSLSLANHPRISVETRERINGIARRLGYQPNPYVAALMRSRRRGKPITSNPVLAIVGAYDRQHGWRNSTSHTVRQIFEGAMTHAAERGYQPQEFWLHQDGMSNERFSEVLHARGIQGVLLGPLPEGANAPNLRWENFSCAHVGMPRLSPPMRTVCHDNYYAALTTVMECHKLGYRRPGLVLMHQHNDRLQRRWEAGYFAAVRSMPDIDAPKPLLLPDWPTLAELRAWLRAEKPDVILVPTADQIMGHLAALGKKVPHDIGVAVFSCPEIGHKLSGVHQNGRLIGAAAIDALVSLVERHERGLPGQGIVTMVEGVWNAGQTLRSSRKGR